LNFLYSDLTSKSPKQFALSLSKGSGFLSWFDKLTANEKLNRGVFWSLVSFKISDLQQKTPPSELNRTPKVRQPLGCFYDQIHNGL
jgi:hypothetical protein